MLFVRSGYIHLAITAGTFRSAGSYGFDRSSQASSTRTDGLAIPSAYYLQIEPSAVKPSYTSARYYGISLRCLSTVLGM